MKTLEQLGVSPYPWKHTPADEWTHAGIDDANGCGVGETYQVAHRDETAETANACICAAAPELYDALYDVVAYCESTHLVPSERFGEILAKVKAALAKAAGEIEVSK